MSKFAVPDVEMEDPGADLIARPSNSETSGKPEAVGPEMLAAPAASVSGNDAELRVRASQIGRLTYRQFETIRELAVESGLGRQVAAVTAWLAADPQDAITQLKRPRMEVIASGVTARLIDIDVMTAPLVRAPENLRMGGHRYNGDFTMPRYTSTADNSAVVCNLGHFEDVEAAMDFYFTQLAKTDEEVRDKNQYGDDIRCNGIRVGGILFPLLMTLPGSSPGIAGWETADCYGRVFFTQDAEGISSAEVLEWMRTVPTDARGLAKHPLQELRNAALAVAGKIRSGTSISESEEARLSRAVMPKTRLILSVDVDIPLDEIRRRVVSLQHLDRPTPFSAATDWQTRAEAVLAWFEQKDLFARPEGVTSLTARRWLDQPIKAVEDGECFGDDIAMIALASMLHSPDTRLDRQVGSALRTRGVTGGRRTHARTEVVAHIVCRALHGDRTSGAEGALSAMERVLRWTALRDLSLDMRPVQALLAEANNELKTEVETRSRGLAPTPGPATRQLAARAAFHLICTPDVGEPLLRRSSHGADKGEGIEPGQVLQRLAATDAGQQQLAQAIFDGRRQFPIRRLELGSAADDHTEPPPVDDLLDYKALRGLALAKTSQIEDRSPAGQVSKDSEALKSLVSKIGSRIESMGARGKGVAHLPYVEDRGWSDPHQSIAALQEVLKKLEFWHQVFKVVHRRRPTDDIAGGEDLVP